MNSTPSAYDTYTSPLATRNASPAMLRLWSARHKFNTWRRVWLAVAQAQHEVGLPVTKEQVEELRAVVERPGGITDEEIRAAEKYERELRHDVMAHVHALGDSCPKAKGIIHLGMTSQDVVCNADLATLVGATQQVRVKVARVLASMSSIALLHSRTPTLGFTHYQPAQPVTVGRRVANWMSELAITLERMRGYEEIIKWRGIGGATGTQASYKALLADDQGNANYEDPPHVVLGESLYEWPELEEASPEWCFVKDSLQGHSPESYIAENPDHLMAAVRASPEHGKLSVEKRTSLIRDFHEWLTMNSGVIRRHRVRDSVELLNRTIVMKFTHQLRYGPRFGLFEVMGQTYPRVIDTFILADLASVAAVLHKIATDIRLLCNRKELDEPFEDKQIGSSAMPYKRNPMRSERICGLARFVMNLVGNAYDTAATQWLERTLDDSSNRRLSLPEAFLALDGALDLMHNVASGLIVHEATVRKNLMAELPFMASENILMACVRLGADRQEYHERIRVHAQAAGLRVKDEGLDNDLLERLKSDRAFWSKARGGPLASELNWDDVMDPMKYVGRSVEQTERFVREVIEPLKAQYGDAIKGLEEGGPRV